MLPHFRRSFSTLFALVLLGSPFRFAFAKDTMLGHDPVIPPNADFVRSIDVEGWAERTNQNGLGAQTGRFRMRFLDPDVNAFVGLMAGFHHFNQDLRTGANDNLDTTGLMANWGGVFGIVRGKHLWELDLLGSVFSIRLGGAVAVVGEHQLSSRWILYHRTEVNAFHYDVIMDADQGLYWMWRPSVGLSLGYRWFTSLHMDRSGPHVGVRLYFQNSKIPFIFPSLG